MESELTALVADPIDNREWGLTPLSEIIDYILPRFHQRHREQLVELMLMAEKVERVHGNKPTCPRGFAKQLNQIRVDQENHMIKKEQILFPLIKQGMEHEHDEAGEQLEVVKFLTNHVTPPEGACNTWQALYNDINTFISDLMEHNPSGEQPAVPRALSGR